MYKLSNDNNSFILVRTALLCHNFEKTPIMMPCTRFRFRFAAMTKPAQIYCVIFIKSPGEQVRMVTTPRTLGLLGHTCHVIEIQFKALRPSGPNYWKNVEWIPYAFCKKYCSECQSYWIMGQKFGTITFCHL